LPGLSVTAPTGVALFDVDGTLIRGTSLFRFLEYRMAAEGRPAGDYRRERRRLAELTTRGAPRVVTNREYFASYRDLVAAEVVGLGKAWFLAEQAQGSLFHLEVVRALFRHRSRGHLVVLVSGSFAPCLAPVAGALGADVVLCTEPTVRSGRFTGEVTTPMIGERKATAVAELLTTIEVGELWAYGDHPSDLPMLEAAAEPVVVGADPGLAAVAAARRWRRLPVTGRPLPTPLPVPVPG
jgi:HAD superfamily hydrolase (TIGR01490 family)